MLKRNVLITGVGGDIGQSVIKCLQDLEYNLDIFGCDVDYYAAGRSMVKKFFHAPWATETKDYLDFILKIVEGENINYIFPISEVEIEFYYKHLDYFKDKKLKIFINDPGLIKIFLDKYYTIEFFRENDLPYPRTYLIEKYNGELNFPVILKKRKGSGGKGLMIVNNEEELVIFREKKDYIVQEIIGTPDEEYTIGVFATPERVYSIAFKRELGYGGLSRFVQLVYNQELQNIAEKLSKICSLQGPLNIQLRKSQGGYIPFEINPRISSTVYSRHFFGFQDVKWWIDLREGRSFEYKLRYKSGIVVRALSEVFFELRDRTAFEQNDYENHKN